jgi:hypothetical protein
MATAGPIVLTARPMVCLSLFMRSSWMVVLCTSRCITDWRRTVGRPAWARNPKRDVGGTLDREWCGEFEHARSLTSKREERPHDR